MRSNGQRRRREKKSEEVAQTSSIDGLEENNQAIEARYPATNSPETNDSAAQSLEIETAQEQPEAVTSSVEASASTTKPVIVEEVQQNLPFSEAIVEDAPAIDTVVSETPTANAAVIDSANENIEPETIQAEPEQAEPEQTIPEQVIPEVNESVSIAEPIQEVIELETSVTNEDVLKTAEKNQAVTEDKSEVIAEPATKTKVKKATVKVAKKVSSKAPNKDKKLARQVKKANRLSGHAASPMTKTETITTMNEIPTSFMASEDRMVHQVSGRTAVAADAISRSSAAATKPA